MNGYILGFVRCRKEKNMIMDNVKCCNCGFNGLVDIGEEKCPQCQMVGALAWKENEAQEVQVD